MNGGPDKTRPTYMDLLMLQLADSAFPTGGFAHSAGLEAAYQRGEIRTAAEVHAFVRWSLAQAGRGAVPFVIAAAEAGLHCHLAKDGWTQPLGSTLQELDELSDAFLTNPVANRVSRLQGRAWLSTAIRVFDRPALQRVASAVDEHRLAPHYAPVFGAILATLGVPAARASYLYLFMTARTVLSAAVRLGIVGTHEAQRIQADGRGVIDRVHERSAALTLDDLAQTVPPVDLWQAGHDRLYSRLFQS
jgi:urease accessory protein